MTNKRRANIKTKKYRVDYWLAFAFLALISVGALMVYSASYPDGIKEFSDGYYFLKRHLLFIMIGLISIVVLVKMPLSLLKKYSFFIYFITVSLCLYTAKYGVEVNEAKRWIRIADRFTVQPSDFLKVGVALYLPRLLNKKNAKGTSINIMIYFFIALSAASVYIQKDLGTSFLIAITILVMYFSSRMHLAEVPILGVVGLGVLYKAIFGKNTYRALRVEAFKNPFADFRNSGWQIAQSMFAVANGGILGVGIGNSVQKYFYIYAAYSDYIFAILSEELGLVGGMSVILLILFIVFKLLKYSSMMEETFESLFLLGFACFFGLQSFIHIGVVVNAIPAKGITLPFISYGGSSILTYMAFIGITFNILRNSKRKELK